MLHPQKRGDGVFVFIVKVRSLGTPRLREGGPRAYEHGWVGPRVTSYAVIAWDNLG